MTTEPENVGEYGELVADMRASAQDLGETIWRGARVTERKAERAAMWMQAAADAIQALQQRVAELEGDDYTQGFYLIADTLGIAAKTCSPKEALHRDVIPCIKDFLFERERLREALTEISNICPVTCDMSVAHMMADIADAALHPTPEAKKEGAPTRNRSSQAGDDIRCPSCGWIFVGYPDEHKLCAVCYPKSLATQQPEESSK